MSAKILSFGIKGQFIFLVLLTALSTLPVNIIAPALPAIAANFGADTAILSLAVAGYAMMTALVGLVLGAASDRFGRRPVALLSIGIFILASIGCACAASIGQFLIFRTLQAAIAACYTIALITIKETSAADQAVSRMGYAASIWAIAPMLGPTSGGLLDQFFGWRMIFIVLAGLGLIMLILTRHNLPTTSHGRQSGHAEFHHALYTLVANPAFWANALCMAFSMGILYIFLFGAPLAIGGSSASLGLYMGLVPAGFIFGSFLSGRYAGQFSLGTMLIIARCTTLCGLLLALLPAALGAAHPLAFFVPCIAIGIGNGLTMPAANMGILSISNDHAGTASGLAAAISIGGGAMIVWLAGFYLNQASGTMAVVLAMILVALLALVAAWMAAKLERRKS